MPGSFPARRPHQRKSPGNEVEDLSQPETTDKSYSYLASLSSTLTWPTCVTNNCCHHHRLPPSFKYNYNIIMLEKSRTKEKGCEWNGKLNWQNYLLGKKLLCCIDAWLIQLVVIKYKESILHAGAKISILFLGGKNSTLWSAHRVSNIVFNLGK